MFISRKKNIHKNDSDRKKSREISSRDIPAHDDRSVDRTDDESSSYTSPMHTRVCIDEAFWWIGSLVGPKEPRQYK